jgi:transposase-like protein
LAECLRKISADMDGDFLREVTRLPAQLVMEEELSKQSGATRYQRTPHCTTQRNGYREGRECDSGVPLRAARVARAGANDL